VRNKANNLISIKAINRRYHGEAFHCSHQDFNDYLQATLYQSRRTERVYVAIDESKNIVGYYALTACSIEFDDHDVMETDDKPMIAARIMALAVDRRMSDRGIARQLLGHAIMTVYQVIKRDTLDINVILCDTPNSRGKSFYLHYGFMALPGTQKAVFLPVDSISHLID